MAATYEQVVAERHDAGMAHIATMPTPPDALVRWAALMARRYGPAIAVHNAGKDVPHQDDRAGALDLSPYKKDWLHALLIVMYGEAPEHWPADWNDALLLRAENWAKGKTPGGIVYPATES